MHSRFFSLLLSIHTPIYNPDLTSPAPDSRVPGGSKAGYRADGPWSCCPSSPSPRRRRCKSYSGTVVPLLLGFALHHV